MAASRRVIGTWSAVVAATTALGCVVWGCVPVPSDRGGTLPPPIIDGEIPPEFNPGADLGGESGLDDDGVQMFDVTIEAVSLFVTGITMDAVLTLVPDSDTGAGETPLARVTLQDTVNDPSETVGITGGILLTAVAGSSGSSGGAFELREEEDGSVTALLVGAGGGEVMNRFILSEGGASFQPGLLGVTYQVESGSSFRFRIDGDRVSGEIDLSGSPVTEFGGSEVYIGTFSGSRRR